MDKHIFKTFRKIALSLAVKVLPLRAISFAVPDPIRSSVDPEIDTWLFDHQATVAEHMSGLSLQMKSLSGTLGHLHSLVSVIAAHAPTTDQMQVSVIGGNVWSDELLFDGEPQVIAPLELKSCDTQDILFDACAAPETQAIRMAHMADLNVNSRHSVSVT